MPHGLVFVIPVPLRRQLPSTSVGRGGPCTRTHHQVLALNRERLQVVCVYGSSWRNPRWLSDRQMVAHRRQEFGAEADPSSISELSDSSWGVLAYLCAAEALQRARRVRKRATLVKTCLSAVLFSSVYLAWTGYSMLNTLTSSSLSDVTHAAFQRNVSVGRLRRLSLPGSVHFAATSLLPGSENVPATAPDFDCKGVQVTFSRILPAVLSRRPLVVSVCFDDPTVRVRQVLEVSEHGVPVGKWDPGLPKQPHSSPIKQDPVILPVAYAGPIDTEEDTARGPKAILGQLSMKNATIFLHPADFGVYGQGPEPVEIRKTDAELRIKDQDESMLLKGVAIANVRGTAVNGGEVDVTATCDLGKVATIKPGDSFVDLSVSGTRVPARNVAAFLNMPFRADRGVLDGKLDISFPYDVNDLVPDVYGTARLDDVSLRFHPDPATPEFSSISGQLRFEEKTMFMDGPSGSLGSLPMTMTGSVDLVGDYDLVGSVRSVDVNNVIDTFDIDKFVPVSGRVKGEAKMTGPLEEPFIRGTMVSVESGSFDRIALEKSKVDFEWDTVAGVLRLTDISAEMVGGGTVSGQGGMYFDMTKVTPFEMSSPAHHPNSPKAFVWSDGSPKRIVIPPAPEDEMDIDVYAPSRPYDSMLFEFSVRNAVGGNLIKWYGGPQAEAASAAIGLVDGDAIIAGHAKDANCRALWRSASPARPVSITASSNSGTVPAKNHTGTGDESDTSHALPDDCEVYARRHDGFLHQARRRLGSNGTNVDNGNEEFPGSRALGGGDFRGAVFMKLGDLPAARRVKVRTTVTNFDLRRLMWGDDRLKDALANTPSLMFSGDTYFKGVLHQQFLPVEVGTGVNPRTPEAELLGAEGAIAVRGLCVNNLVFEESMTGSLKFGAKDLQLTLDERQVNIRSTSPRKAKPVGTSGRLKVEQGEKGRNLNSALEQPGLRRKNEQGTPLPASDRLERDQIKLSGSLESGGALTVRCGTSEIVFSLSEDDCAKTRATFFVRDFSIDRVLGGNGKGSDGIPCGSFSADGVINVTDKRGDWMFTLDGGRLGLVSVDRVTSSAGWRDNTVFLQKTVAKVGKSDYHIEGSCSFAEAGSDLEPSFEGKVSVPNAEIQELLAVLEKSRSLSVAQDHHGSGSAGRKKHFGFSRDEQSRVSERDTASVIPTENESLWSVPPLSFEDQISWFKAFVENEKERSRRTRVVGDVGEEIVKTPRPRLSDLRGRVRGTLAMRYGAHLSASEPKLLEKSKLPLSMTGPLSKVFAEFSVEGDELMLGSQSIGEVKANGGLSQGNLYLDALSLRGQSGFESFVKAAIGMNGDVSGYAFVKGANASTLGRFILGRIRLEGEVNARLDLGGVISDPVVDGRAVWTQGTLNGQSFQDAKGDVRCRAGRCSLDVNARFGGRAAIQDSTSEPFDVHQSLSGRDSDHKSPEKTSEDAYVVRGLSSSRDRRRIGEPLKFSMSAPVRFYVLEHIRRTAPSGLLTDLEPLLNHIDDNSIYMDVDVRRYGLLLLNTFFPEVGWIDGRSDVVLKVRGTLDDPVIAGRASVVDGKLLSTGMSKPFENIKGDVVFEESGAVTLRSVYGRYNGRPISASGTLPLSEKHSDQIREVADQSVPRGGSIPRAMRRSLMESKATASARLERFARGIVCEVGDVLVDVKDNFYGRVSGRVVVLGSLRSPLVSGNVSFSHGTLYLSGSSTSPDLTSTSVPSAVSQMRPERMRREIEKQIKHEGQRQLPLRTQEPVTTPEILTSGDSASTDDLEARSRTSGELPSNDGFVSLGMDGLKISLGRDVRVVYPYVMNFGATGVVTVSGTASDPVPRGAIKLTDGSVNLLTSRMEINRGAENFVRFDGVAGGGPDPIVSLELKHRGMVLQVKEARASQWTEHLSIVDKKGERFDNDAWLDLIRDQLEEVRRGLSTGIGIPNLVVKYLINSYSLKGKVGDSQWRLYPAFISPTSKLSREQLQKFSRNDLIEDLGVGAEFDYGKVVLSGRRSLNGHSSGNLTISPNKRVKIEFEGSENTISAEIQVDLSGAAESVRTQRARITVDEEASRGKFDKPKWKVEILEEDR